MKSRHFKYIIIGLEGLKGEGNHTGTALAFSNNLSPIPIPNPPALWYNSLDSTDDTSQTGKLTVA